MNVPLPSPSCIPIHHLKVPPSYDVLGSQDPFDFLEPEATTNDDASPSSCGSSYDDDSSSVSTVQHANTGTGRVTPSLSPSTSPERAQPSPTTPCLGVGRVNASFDLSLHPKLSQASRTPEYSHKRTIMINACSISHGFRKKFDYQPDTVFRALLDTGA